MGVRRHFIRGFPGGREVSFWGGERLRLCGGYCIGVEVCREGHALCGVGVGRLMKGEMDQVFRPLSYRPFILRRLKVKDEFWQFCYPFLGICGLGGFPSTVLL